MLKAVTVAVNQLKIGMYVAELDRPWLETPFLFQGFYIRDQDEIEELKKYCDYVYVYIEGSADMEPLKYGVRSRMLARISGAAADGFKKSPLRFEPRFLPRFLSRARRARPPESFEDEVAQRQEVYKETANLKEEMKNATIAHEEAVHTVHELMDSLRTSDKMDVQRLQTAVTPMVDSILRNPAALACLVRLRSKDSYVYRHSLASMVWATVLGRHVGLSRDDLQVVALGGLLLDVGKVKLPDAVLQKPGTLDERERELVQRHVELSLGILKKTRAMDKRVMDMVAHHHERFNGSGYPEGLKGSQIPVFGRIAGLVDTYDAMISPRPYAKPRSSYDAFRELRALADVEFQTEMIDQFTQAIGVFPTGTLVELNTGEIAVVTKQNRVRRLRPEIMIIMNSEKEFLESFRVADLSKESQAEKGRHETLWIERGVPPGSYGIDPAEFFLD
jgi:HD-GYP domain-containing protein (c-di-GMP phosphodiesterase class II)